MAGGRAGEMMIQGGLDKILSIGNAGIQAFSRTVAGYTYLLLDRFTTNASAPLSSPRTCEPGPGTLTIADTGNRLSISGSKLIFTGSTSGGTDPRLTGPSQARLAGRAIISTLNCVLTGEILFGWATDALGTNLSYRQYLRSSGTAGLVDVWESGLVGQATGTLAASTDTRFACIMRSTGMFYVLGNKLQWVGVSGSGALYPVMTYWFGITGQILDDFRVIDLSAVNSAWATDYGIATTRLAGARSAGDTFTHTANCLIEWTTTTLDGSASHIIGFRRQDATNYWWVQVNSSGAFNLWEQIAGVNNLRGSTGGGTVTNGHRIVMVLDGTTIKGYSNNVLRWTYSSASNFALSTAGVVIQLGAAGVLSDLVAWPRDISAYIPANV